MEKVNRIKDYAFIFFETREGAMTAQEATNEMDLMGSHISVSLAKPAAKNRDVPPKSGYKTGFGDYTNLLPNSFLLCFVLIRRKRWL